jgi:hypothetical protein
MARGIDDAGQVVGTAGNGGFLATPNGATTDGAPLPVTGGTLPGAILLLGWMGSRVRRRRTA